MKKNTNRRIAKLLFVIIILVLDVCLFGSAASENSSIPVLGLNLELLETWIDPVTGQTLPYNGPIPVMPGMEISKIVAVCNTGSISAYVRVCVQKQVVLAQNVEGTVDSSLILLGLNEEYWLESNGYYYYRKPLAAGDQTEPLFTYVKFAPQMGNLYEGSQVRIRVNIEAVRIGNNGVTAMDAQHWPSEEKEGGNA